MHGTALTTILPILFQYCYKYCFSDSRNLWAVMKAGGLARDNLIQPTISLEMPVPSQGHYGFHSFTVVLGFYHCPTKHTWEVQKEKFGKRNYISVLLLYNYNVF
jgi:hypothetical protein